MRDTDADIEQNEDVEVEKFSKVENGFPIDCNIKMILLDKNQNILDLYLRIRVLHLDCYKII